MSQECMSPGQNLLGNICDLENENMISLKGNNRFCYNDKSQIYRGPNLCAPYRSQEEVWLSNQINGTYGYTDYYDTYYPPIGSSIVLPVINGLSEMIDEFDFLNLTGRLAQLENEQQKKTKYRKKKIQWFDDGTPIIVVNFPVFDRLTGIVSLVQFSFEKVISSMTWHFRFQIHSTSMISYLGSKLKKCPEDFENPLSEYLDEYQKIDVSAYIFIFLGLLLSLALTIAEPNWKKLKNFKLSAIMKVHEWVPDKFCVLNPIAFLCFLIIFGLIIKREFQLKLVKCEKFERLGYSFHMMSLYELIGTEQTIKEIALVLSFILTIRFLYIPVPFKRLDSLLSSLRDKSHLLYKYFAVLVIMALLFSQLLLKVYGQKIRQYFSTWTSFLGIFRAVYGDIDFEEMRFIAPVYGPIIHTVLLLIFNMFLFPFIIALILDDDTSKLDSGLNASDSAEFLGVNPVLDQKKQAENDRIFKRIYQKAGQKFKMNSTNWRANEDFLQSVQRSIVRTLLKKKEQIRNDEETNDFSD